MKFKHITIQTSKADETIDFFKKFAGLSEVRSFGKITFIGNAPDETLVEIIRDENSALCAKGLSVGFACNDLDAKREELIKAGFNPTGFSTPNPKTRFFFVEEPSGITVQFINE